MTPYERLRIAAEPFLPVLYGRARNDLTKLLAGTTGCPAAILDVGGRRSPYTVGLKANVTVLDLPRETDVQHELGLGVDEQLLDDLQRRRSNIRSVLLQDMTRCDLPDESYDGVICVEVIEHVLAEHDFMAQVARVLKPGGWLYVTTPNGDYIPNKGPQRNPDHMRHYTRQSLAALLGQHFARANVVWAVHTGRNRVRGLRSLSPRRPLHAAQAAVSNLANHLESRGLDEQPRRTAHLIATAWK